jgi:hypothetical protein
MCDIPVPIADGETIVRGILDIHVNEKGKLKSNAFRPRPETDEVSVMRHSYMGSDACKTKARELSHNQINYRGLAVLLAREIRDAGSQAIDSREGNYCGHAHISHGFIVPRDEPLESPLIISLVERLRALRSVARYYPDPEPSNEIWTGQLLV